MGRGVGCERCIKAKGRRMQSKDTCVRKNRRKASARVVMYICSPKHGFAKSRGGAWTFEAYGGKNLESRHVFQRLLGQTEREATRSDFGFQTNVRLYSPSWQRKQTSGEGIFTLHLGVRHDIVNAVHRLIAPRERSQELGNYIAGSSYPRRRESTHVMLHLHDRC